MKSDRFGLKYPKPADFLVDFSKCEEKTLCLPLFIPTMNENHKYSIGLSAFSQIQTKILTAEE